jgi:hypothetical protein
LAQQIGRFMYAFMAVKYTNTGEQYTIMSKITADVSIHITDMGKLEVIVKHLLGRAEACLQQIPP